jgi:hypothetical protein
VTGPASGSTRLVTHLRLIPPPWSRSLCQHGQNHIAAGEAGLQRFGAGGLDRGQPMVEHRAEHFDELTIAVGVLL